MQRVGHKLPQTTLFIDIDALSANLMFLSISKQYRKCCCKMQAFDVFYVHYEKWAVHSNRMNFMLPVYMTHSQDSQANTQMCSLTLSFMSWEWSKQMFTKPVLHALQNLSLKCYFAGKSLESSWYL